MLTTLFFAIALPASAMGTPGKDEAFIEGETANAGKLQNGEMGAREALPRAAPREAPPLAAGSSGSNRREPAASGGASRGVARAVTVAARHHPKRSSVHGSPCMW